MASSTNAAAETDSVCDPSGSKDANMVISPRCGQQQQQQQSKDGINKRAGHNDGSACPLSKHGQLHCDRLHAPSKEPQHPGTGSLGMTQGATHKVKFSASDDEGEKRESEQQDLAY